MWYWKRMEKTSLTNHVKNKEVLHRVKKDKNTLHNTQISISISKYNKRRLPGLVTSCIETTFYNRLLKDRSDGKARKKM